MCTTRTPFSALARDSLDVADAGAGDAEVVCLQTLVAVHRQQFAVDVLLAANGACLADLAGLALVPGGKQGLRVRFSHGKHSGF